MSIAMPDPLDYVIFHPPRVGYQAEGEAEIDGDLQHWRGTVWTDPWWPNAQTNEDPYVWDAEMWLYSYCHASQLRRKPDYRRPTVCEGSRLFFCETVAGRDKWLRVDTVFVVDQRAKWEAGGEQVPGRFEAHQANATSDIWRRHLQHGLRVPPEKGHTGRYTYVANAGGRSYLPLGPDGLPTAVPVAKVPDLTSDVKAALPVGRSSYPCKLSPHQADTLEMLISVATRTRVRRLTCGAPLDPSHVPIPAFVVPAPD